MLFDDTKSDDDNRLLDFTLRSLIVEPSKPMSLFARSQFSFFAALVEGSVQSPQSVPHWGLVAPKDVHKTASGPAIWGPYASNASWRIEVDRNSGPWMIDKFVVEYR